MSTSYPSELTGSSGPNHGAFYPHSMNVLSPMQANFQMTQSPSSEMHSDVRGPMSQKPVSETMGTPLKQGNTSSVNMGNGSDMSPTSPYRVITANSGDAMTSSPYKTMEPSSVQAAIATFPPLQPGANSSIIRVEGNVVYSSQPLTAADFAPQMMHPTSSTMFQPQMGGVSQFPPQTGGFSQFPSQMGGFSQFPPMGMSAMSFPQSGTSGFMSSGPTFMPPGPSFMGASPMTPRLLMNQQLTPRAYPGGSMGLTPRSFQESFPTSSVIPTHISGDPAMMMFAETFRNQCVAMSQYYAAHPEEVVESPKSVKSAAQPLFRPAVLRKQNVMSSLKTIQDQENYDTANQTPSGTEKPHKTDDVMDLLNQLVGEEDNGETDDYDKPTESEPETRPHQSAESPVMRAPESWTQTLLKKFACGTRAH